MIKFRKLSLSGNLPANLVVPAITGTIGQGNVLTCSTGTWTNSPTSYSYQWYSNSTAVGTNSSTYTQAAGDVGNYISCIVTATNASGSRSAISNSVGPVTAGFFTPAVSLASGHSAGTAPLVMSLSISGGAPAGIRWQWEFAGSQTPAKNGDGSYTTTTQNNVTFMDGDSYGRLDLGLGYSTPSGPFAFHMRGLVDDQNGLITLTDSNGSTGTYTAVTAWSNDYNDSIGGSVATLTGGSGATGAGNSRSQYVNVVSPFYELVMNTANIGALCASRATIAAANGKFHCEVKAKYFAASGGNSYFWCGFDDDSISYSTYVLTANVPGTSGKNGFTIQCQKGNANASIAINGNAFVTMLLPSAPTDGVSFAFDIDTTQTNPTVLITYFDGTTAHVLNGGSAYVMTTGKPSSWWEFQAGGSGNGTAGSGQSDTIDFNPSSSVSPWLVTPQTGFQQYG